MPNANTPSAIPNAITRSLICIDAVKHADYSGAAYNPYVEQPIVFEGLMELVRRFEVFFNEISFPQPFFQDRSFLRSKGVAPRPGATPRRFHGDGILTAHTGALATFELDVRYRKNASWQGDLLWREGGMTYSFSSALEFLKLVDRSVRSPQARPSL